MSNGESVLINIRKMVENGEELSEKEFRIFMLSTAIDGEKKRVVAAKELKQIKRLVYEKNEELKEKIIDLENKDACSQAETNQEEIIRIRNKSDRNDVMVTIVTIVGTTWAAISGSR